ncbi:MAG: hypothetical protein ACREBU_14870 [Nitrososphaera sp.]
MPTSGASLPSLKRISSDSDSTHTAMIAYKDSLNKIRLAKWDSSTGNYLGTEIADQSLAHDLPSISITPDDRIHIFSLSGDKVYETTKIGSILVRSVKVVWRLLCNSKSAHSANIISNGALD